MTPFAVSSLSAIAPEFVMQERAAPSRPTRLGTRRRKSRQAISVLPEAGASRFGRKPEAPSLDTGKQLATTVANWLENQKTNWDKEADRRRLWRQLVSTVHQIWQGWFAKPRDDAEQAWWDRYDEQKAKIADDSNLEYDIWLEKYVIANGLPTCPEAYLRALYLEQWKKQNRPVGKCAHVLRWEKQHFQLLNCQGLWVGYAAECCDTKGIAVPVGCNHRLCPLCGWHRSQKAQRRMRTMFDHLNHPNFLTLTVPNVKRISKRTFHFFRKRVRVFIAQHKDMFLGGVYSIETTFNRTEGTWHIHAHVLFDQAFVLPRKDQRVQFAGRNIPAFTLIKLALEFDWSRLWLNVKDKSGKWANPLGKLPRRNAADSTLEGERYLFEQWVRGCWANALKERDWRSKSFVDIDLSPEEKKRRTEWNLAHRRVLDIKPVTDREKAAKEVLKYITKSVKFCDLPNCVEDFHNATKGARLIQTFGSWYGVDIDLYSSAAHPEDWSELKCGCGENHWVRVGLFQYRDVAMDVDGRYRLPRIFNSGGTVPRPTIRALEGRASPEEFSYATRS